ncbi:MAG: ECF transporter S component, partial [Oscillospiraceae bacterium]|nr:ECF transporter S component [Oscillospiraceae bacterium]
MSNTKTTSSAKRRNSTVNLTVTAALAAIIVVMTFTPVGYLNIGIVEITFLTIPVAIGAIVCGPASGAVLGAVFGLTSFMQCFGIGRPSVFGAALLAINPISTAIICFLPRILAGFLSGLIFKAFKNKQGVISYAVTS